MGHLIAFTDHESIKSVFRVEFRFPHKCGGSCGCWLLSRNVTGSHLRVLVSRKLLTFFFRYHDRPNLLVSRLHRNVRELCGQVFLPIVTMKLCWDFDRHLGFIELEWFCRFDKRLKRDLGQILFHRELNEIP